MSTQENIPKNDLILTLADLQVPGVNVDKNGKKKKGDVIGTYADKITKGQMRINEIPLLQKKDLGQLLSKLPPDKAEALKIAQNAEAEYKQVNRAVASGGSEPLKNWISHTMGTVSEGYAAIGQNLAEKEKTSKGGDKAKVGAFRKEVDEAQLYAQNIIKDISAV